MSDNRIEYVIFGPDDLVDFQELILEPVWEELTSLGSFEDNDIAAIGALENGRPVGALIARLCDRQEVQLGSLWVAPGARGQGIGKGLLHACLEEALRVYTSVYTIPEEEPVLISLHVDYALGGEDLAAFEHFLKENGFKGFARSGSVYVIPAEGAPIAPSPDARALSSVSDDLTEALEMLAEDTDFQMEPALSFFAGSEDKPACVVLCALAGETDYTVVSQAFDGCTESEYAGTLGRVFCALRAACPGAVVLADSRKNAFPAVWDHLTDACGETAAHASAVLNALFE